MAKLRNTAEGGTNNTAVTVGNAGGASGDAPSAVTTLTFSNAHPAFGSLGYAAPTGAADGIWRWAVTGTALSTSFFVYQDGTVSSDSGLLRVSHTTDTTSFSAYLNSFGMLRVSVKGNTNAWTAGAAFPNSQQVRLEAYSPTIGTSTTTGQLRVAYFIGNSVIPVYDSGMMTGLNLGGDLGGFTNVRFGKQITTASVGWWFDNFAVDTGSDAVGLIGPPTNLTPTVALPARQVVPAGSTISMPITASDPDGPTPTLSTTVVRMTAGSNPQTILSNSTAATPSWIAAVVPAVDVVTTTATDSGGATSTATTEYMVVQTGAFRVLNGGASGSWSNIGGTANAGASVADALDSTYVESPDQTGVESEERFRLEPLDARASLLFNPGSQMSPVVGGTNKFRVYNGNTKIAEWDITQSTDVVINGNAASGSNRWMLDASGIPAGAPLSIAWATVT